MVNMKHDIKLIALSFISISYLVAWLYPLIGIIISILGIIISKSILKMGENFIAKMSLRLSYFCLVLTLLNSALGAYMGYKGMIK